MQQTLTIRLPEKVRRQLRIVSASENISVSDLVRKSLQRSLAIYRFRRLRKKVLPFAEAQGLLTDEDVFRALK